MTTRRWPAAIGTVLVMFVGALTAGVTPAQAEHENVPAPDGGASPWHYSERWAITGSYYGQGLHTEKYNDYYAQDWTRNGSATATCGAALYPIYDGMRVDYVGTSSTLPGRLVMSKWIGSYKYDTKYLHMSAIYVRVGQIVDQTTKVGLAGKVNTGSCHLHVGVHRLKGSTWYSIPPKWCGRAYPDDGRLWQGC